jgi:peroxiredoxin Q/BCP
MARKTPARSARKSAKSSKPKAQKKVGAKKSAAPKSRAAVQKPVGKVSRKPVVTKRAPAGASGRPTTPSRMSAGRSAASMAGRPGKSAPGKGKPQGKGARPQQGTLPFEVGPPAGPPDHLPKRRGSKVGGPDWPGENLTVGMAAPEFELPSTLGRKVTLKEFRGKRVILYFYPKDDTPGCTMEACAFRDNLPRIDAKDAVVLGVSLDDELSHQRFAQKYNLPFPLLADIDAAVSRQYGVYKEKNMYGRSFWGIERTTFVIDREGKVENVFRRVKVEGHADEVLATLAV